MRLPLAIKIAGIVSLIIVLALGLTIMLNFFKFEQTLRNVTESRLGFTAVDLEKRIQTGLDLGLDLAVMTNVQVIIDAEAADDPDIVAIDVFDDRGQILFTTGEGGSVPASWRVAFAAGETGVWRVSDPDRIIVGSRLTNNFGFEVGGVALSYSRAVFDARLDAMIEIMTRSGIIILAGTAIVGLIVAALIVSATTRSVRRVRQAVTRFLEEPDGVPAYEGGRSALERDYAQAEARLRQAGRELESAGQSLAADVARG